MSNDANSKLRENLLGQQERLLHQLADLEEIKDELEEEEYLETKADTLDQIMDVTSSLEKLESGNMTLSDKNSSQLKITREAISNAFKTPEVLRMFARREPDQLRQRLKERERDFKLGKLNDAIFHQEKRELLHALRQLGANLTDEEKHFVNTAPEEVDGHFERVSESSDNAASILKWAKQQAGGTSA